jgi:leucyl/phenylalanyl-tRNA--protein transferase
LNTPFTFPPVEKARFDGLLASGGDLEPETLELAYRSGIFPNFHSGQPIYWWSPDPRCVLFPDKLRISDSMRKVLRDDEFRFSVDEAFARVIHHCGMLNRRGQSITWIDKDMEAAYIRLHDLGLAHSFECWHGDELVGGLYGIRLERVFCGESMFHRESNASKFVFIRFVQYLKRNGFELIDCQFHNKHLESLGAEMMRRKDYLEYLK